LGDYFGQQVGLGVAVRDATAAAKAAAHAVSEWSNDDGAVAREADALVRAGRFGEAVSAAFDGAAKPEGTGI